MSNTSNWISVDDDLPEEEGMYICHFSDGLIETFPFFDDENRNYWGVIGIAVTHWMQLPEPPAGGES